jgi:hypothetical protein
LLSANLSEQARRRTAPAITIPLPFAKISPTVLGRSPIKEPRRMQFEIPEDAHVHIVIGRPVSARACVGLDPGAGGELLALPGEASAARTAPRFGRFLVKSGLGVMLLVGSFAVGQHLGSSARAPELARTAAALPRPAQIPEQYAFPDPPQPREAPVQAAGQVPADLQRQLQQPPTVLPPPGQAGAPETRGKNPFGLEN